MADPLSQSSHHINQWNKWALSRSLKISKVGIKRRLSQFFVANKSHDLDTNANFPMHKKVKQKPELCQIKAVLADQTVWHFVTFRIVNLCRNLDENLWSTVELQHFLTVLLSVSESTIDQLWSKTQKSQSQTENLPQVFHAMTETKQKCNFHFKKEHRNLMIACIGPWTEQKMNFGRKHFTKQPKSLHQLKQITWNNPKITSHCACFRTHCNEIKVGWQPLSNPVHWAVLEILQNSVVMLMKLHSTPFLVWNWSFCWHSSGLCVCVCVFLPWHTPWFCIKSPGINCRLCNGWKSGHTNPKIGQKVNHCFPQ